MLPVASGRGGPFNIYWEVHGSGDIKLVVSMDGSYHVGYYCLPAPLLLQHIKISLQNGNSWYPAVLSSFLL